MGRRRAALRLQLTPRRWEGGLPRAADVSGEKCILMITK